MAMSMVSISWSPVPRTVSLRKQVLCEVHSKQNVINATRRAFLLGQPVLAARPKTQNSTSTRGHRLVTRASVTSERRKKVLDKTKGFRSGKSNCYRIAHQRVIKAEENAFRDRRLRKRDFRRLWIARINASARLHGLSYSQFMHGLYRENIRINRKILSAMEPEVFERLAKISSESLLKKKEEVATANAVALRAAAVYSATAL